MTEHDNLEHWRGESVILYGLNLDIISDPEVKKNPKKQAWWGKEVSAIKYKEQTL